MINLFKKSKQMVEGIKQSMQPVKDVNEVIAEIHNDFYGSCDNIFEEAKSILNDSNEKFSKATRLINLGFTQAEESNIAIKSFQEAGLINHYSVTYPHYKFITEKQYKALCFKYGFVSGDISLFKGFVPESKLKQIENFKISEQDEAKILIYSDEGIEGTDFDLRGTDANRFQYGVDYLSKNTYSYVSVLFPEHKSYFSQYAKVRYNANKFQICAPAKQMDCTGLKVAKDGYTLVEIDPIVTKIVIGGRLIVAAWGIESSDEIVVNEKMN